MPSITMSDVVDVISTAGTPKLTKVAAIKNRPPYAPALDYYRPLRMGIINTHVQARDRDALDPIIDSAHIKKVANYREIIAGYKRWWGRKQLQWFDPPRGIYQHGEIEVNVNPELGLSVDGERIVIKLYCKDDPLTKLRVDPSLALMELALRAHLPADTTVGILDARSGKLYKFGLRDTPRLKAMVDGELAYISTIWPQV